MELKQEHFEWDAKGQIWCKPYRMKSEILSPVPLLKAAEIANKYRDEPECVKRGAIFPFLTNQYVNRCLKNIQEICEFDIPVTFHVARHTFAKTVALKNGVPIETIQIMMGHAKITTTQIYADVDEVKILAISVNFKLTWKKEGFCAAIIIKDYSLSMVRSLIGR